jgi:fumarylacetoacetase
MLDETHDPALRSWEASANTGDSDFSLQNLPYGVFAPAGSADWRIGVAIGAQVLDLRAAVQRGVFSSPVFSGPDRQSLTADTLNAFMERGRPAWRRVRVQLSHALRAGSVHEDALRACVHAQSDVQHRVPAHIGDYTDFFTSIHHATRVGQLLRPDNALLPNYRWLPIAYHGRTSSIVISGTPIRRPAGQQAARGAVEPAFGPSRRLDYELELAAYVGTPNAMGTPIPVALAEDHAFGFCLLNDWSARDIQAWEYQPLGPFLAKNFGTTISPWIVTLDALAPFRLPWARGADDPPLLPYLDAPGLRTAGAIDIGMQVWLRTPAMRAQGQAPACLSTSNYRDAYWCLAQLVAHHTSGGCNLRAGDLLATGTQSGPAPAQSGCLLELTRGGKDAIVLPNGEERRFLEDGDEITLSARCQRPGAATIGFGSCVGAILPALG